MVIINLEESSTTNTVGLDVFIAESQAISKECRHHLMLKKAL